MKKTVIIASLFATSLIFTACGGGGGSTGGSTASAAPQQQQATSKVVPLNIGEAVAVKPGYSIVDADDEAVLDILVSGDTKTVTLKSGAASLKMPI